ncbi:MAG TPA: hypothetical protein VGC76_07650 [Pyrinomonadaceae bacterium]|jgi:hypothetical protein
MNRKVFLAILAVFVFSLVFLSADKHQQTVEAQSFDVCLTDDGSGASLRFSSSSGDYMFCNGGKTLSGTGSIMNRGGVISLQQDAADRRVSARVSTSAKNGSASVQSPVGKTIGTIADTNTANSSCSCR